MQHEKEIPSYSQGELERQVQKTWQETGAFVVDEKSGKPKFYCLSMFPYPSGQLHMGHVRTYTLGDVIGRFQRLNGKHVLQPMGWDAFGLPAENAAIKHKVAPAEWTLQNIAQMKRQMQSLGFSYDWSREFATCTPEYYRWEQWFFTKMFAKGLVYKKAAWVNWDPVDQTVLANEQVVDGKGWRSGAVVERRELSQWFVKITDYAEELLSELDHLPGWPDKIKTMQRNWLGRSEGVEISFPLDGGDSLSVYTTRPDTLLGVTYLAVAAQHSLAREAALKQPDLQAFLEECNRVKVAEADMAKLEKKGMNTGSFARHPLTGEAIPIWVGNFVLMEYGSGAVMSVPGHDQRDWEFAKQYDLPIQQVIEAVSGEEADLTAEAYTVKGRLINSGEFDGLEFSDAFSAIATALEEKSLGTKQVNFRLRDWGVSRQRYWGCPIPIIHCDKCGAVPVPEDQLPVELPTDIVFEGVGSPIKKMPEWYQVACPECGAEALRETDTFDTFMESSWYHARFMSSDSETAMVDDRAKYWRQVDHYVGGEEHAILHLLYARFFHKVMRDEGMLDSNEPFEKLLALGMVLKDGSKMSKSSGDAGDPKILLERFGADAVRMAMMFAAPPEQSFEWAENGVEAAHRWLRARFWLTVQQHCQIAEIAELDVEGLNDSQRELRRLTHETLAKARDDYDRRLAFNTVIAAVMTLMNSVIKFSDRSDQGLAVKHEALRVAVLVMSPITPHICHVLWQKLTSQQIESADWIETDEGALEKSTIELVVQVNGKLRARLAVPAGLDGASAQSAAEQHETIAKLLEGVDIRKVIHVPDKLINFVVSQ
ncbi:MAG: leucine--tRNA ligase [Gammaproteobacteria bacterium]|jgi:leucyl-tRNA synthetase|nr:leucine--tRNA ligase [Gammaproteobacteria bacterium]MBT5203747.1 leucine--tRNA ligase [Gammaproteobacteria bacterium]MBT5601792.1 leucine--tRNA ligase [Gammaproteobacteria bacterium]